MKLLLNNIEETIKFGQELALISKSDDIFCLKGNLGSGKTTIARAFISFLTKNNKIRKETFNFYVNFYKNSYYIILISIIVFSNILWFLLAPAYRFGIFYNLSFIIFFILPLWLKFVSDNFKFALNLIRYLVIVFQTSILHLEF